MFLNCKVGGIEAVTLGDVEARARKSQKSVLERKAPPTFPFLIEMRDRHHWVAHRVCIFLTTNLRINIRKPIHML